MRNLFLCFKYDCLCLFSIVYFTLYSHVSTWNIITCWCINRCSSYLNFSHMSFVLNFIDVFIFFSFNIKYSNFELNKNNKCINVKNYLIYRSISSITNRHFDLLTIYLFLSRLFISNKTFKKHAFQWTIKQSDLNVIYFRMKIFRNSYHNIRWIFLSRARLTLDIIWKLCDLWIVNETYFFFIDVNNNFRKKHLNDMIVKYKFNKIVIERICHNNIVFSNKRICFFNIQNEIESLNNSRLK